ncbi:hypothetical protein BDV28DRAFT_84792 [Aspergillus coremiiformis]|uniref:Uncharacterized protein n=1 Tax=Aspergillus coremiiformis TaxID=138285 RepID=A0A5N6ZB18_9EURO|nr:hypothetical protein BDV28DRAFT_84792 [Aspergillus coremiiformis]
MVSDCLHNHLSCSTLLLSVTPFVYTRFPLSSKLLFISMCLHISNFLLLFHDSLRDFYAPVPNIYASYVKATHSLASCDKSYHDSPELMFSDALGKSTDTLVSRVRIVASDCVTRLKTRSLLRQDCYT